MSEHRQRKVWLDDRREPPDRSWTWVKTPEEAIELLRGGQVAKISLDHDLGLTDETGRERTGYDVLTSIEREVALHGFEAPTLAVHSANPPAHERMLRAIEAILKPEPT